MEVVKVVNEFVLHEDPVQSIERISFERDCRSLSNEGHLDNTPLEVLRDLVYVNCSDRWIRLACYSQYRIPGNLKRGHWALEDSLDYYTPWPFHHQELPLFVEQGYRTARKMAIICNIRHGPTATRPSSWYLENSCINIPRTDPEGDHRLSILNGITWYLNVPVDAYSICSEVGGQYGK